MHDNVGLGGPLVWVLVGLVSIVGLGAAWVTQDALRRGQRAFDAVPEPRWVYIVPQAAFLTAFVASMFLGRTAAAMVLLATPLTLVEQVAYLLRIVFPSQHRLEAMHEREDAEDS